MMIFTEDRDQPISLTCVNGYSWVDNGDGTVTWMDDPDGEKDIPWDSAHPDVDAATMHTYDCRIHYGEASMCTGGQDCADVERAVYAKPHGLRQFAARNWLVEL